jgi:hypothetical protein
MSVGYLLFLQDQIKGIISILPDMMGSHGKAQSIVFIYCTCLPMRRLRVTWSYETACAPGAPGRWHSVPLDARLVAII